MKVPQSWQRWVPRSLVWQSGHSSTVLVRRDRVAGSPGDVGLGV